MKTTVRVVGDAIKRASVYLPIRNLAAALATTAKPKDYLGQADAIYKGFLKRWRYVRDPVVRELVTQSPEAVYKLVLAGDRRGVGLGLGAGDCDCATVALGSMFEAVGLPVRLATIAKPGAPPGPFMDHIYPEVKIPRIGWIPADPVLHPRAGFGDSPPASRKVVYNLDGAIVELSGNVRGLGEATEKGETMLPRNWSREAFRTYGEIVLGATDPVPNNSQWRDYSGMLGEIEVGSDGSDLAPWESVGLREWGKHVGALGYIDGDEVSDMAVEVGPEDTNAYSGLARTPMIELSPENFRWMRRVGRPYHGMLGLADDGQVYTYDGFAGFFKKLFKKIKKGVKRVAGRIRKNIRRVVKRLPGGKMLLKIGDKFKKVAMKVVRPLTKFVGKYASKLAPIAALIPGYGPAIAAGLHVAGKVAKTMNRFGIKIKPRKNRPAGVVASNPAQLLAFKKDLERQAAIMARQKAAQN